MNSRFLVSRSDSTGRKSDSFDYLVPGTHRMKRNSQKGFTFIEMILVIIMVGIIGSMAATMLFQGADIFVSETNRQGFVSESRSAFWRLMRETQGQTTASDFLLSDANSLYLKDSQGNLKDFQTGSPSYFNFRLGTGSYNSLSNALEYTLSTGFQFYNSNYSAISDRCISCRGECTVDELADA